MTDYPPCEGFLVHWWTSRGEVRLCGRLTDGRSFAARFPGVPSDWVVLPSEAARASALLEQAGVSCEVRPLEAFDGTALVALRFAGSRWKTAEAILVPAGITHRGEPPRAAEDLLLARGITGGVRLRGVSGPGRRVGVALTSPEMEPAEVDPVLVWASLDIETSREGQVRAIALSQKVAGVESNLVLFLPDFASESALLMAAGEAVRRFDPDVLTGWNVLDFDLAHLAERHATLGVPFLWGRTDEPVRVRKKPGSRTSAFVPGRQVVDAMRVARGSGTRFEDQTLATVSSHVLGFTKTVELRGEAKLVELDRLYEQEPVAFCDYCLQDARLVLGILEKTGLDDLTVRRAALTGVGLDLAWTSIPVFERIYALELSSRGILPPATAARDVSGAAGGMVLEAQVGLFSDVLVFDFRSLYPSIILSFGIDPLGYERPGLNPLAAPNGARFSREPAILPGLIATYFARRKQAQARGDETASYVYKILMNSFYGVLGSAGCRYGRTELAGAITGFGRRILEYARDWFVARQMPVLYGDTDSVFVQTRRDGDALAAELNRDLAAIVEQTWNVSSHLHLRCEKRYLRFVIPPMRHGVGEEIRGRAKGYAGWLENDGERLVEIKGMEAVRSDWTPLARRFQTELLEKLFEGAGRDELCWWRDNVLGALRRHELDAELVYRKILRRPAQDYTGNTPPQVKAARLLGWTDRKGSVEYWMTAQGPRPVGLPGAPPDLDHYLEHQLRPLWDSLLEAAAMDPGPPWGGQLELGW